jgi:hypothetical protein
MDEHVHTPECEELRAALEDARSRMDPPLRDSAVPLTQRVFTLEPDITPDASPAVAADIRHLEQSLRDMGCLG